VQDNAFTITVVAYTNLGLDQDGSVAGIAVRGANIPSFAAQLKMSTEHSAHAEFCAYERPMVQGWGGSSTGAMMSSLDIVASGNEC
jgi:hypothetical protein